MTRPRYGRSGPEASGRASGVEVLRCDVTGVSADVVAVDALARLALALRRQECRLRLYGASEELRALVTFMGLAEVLLE
jgi:ABC-type transporter Mla MlaB component